MSAEISAKTSTLSKHITNIVNGFSTCLEAYKKHKEFPEFSENIFRLLPAFTKEINQLFSEGYPSETLQDIVTKLNHLDNKVLKYLESEEDERTITNYVSVEKKFKEEFIIEYEKILVEVRKLEK